MYENSYLSREEKIIKDTDKFKRSCNVFFKCRKCSSFTSFVSEYIMINSYYREH